MPGGSGDRVRRKCGQEPLLWVTWEETSKAGLELTRLTISGALGIGADPGFLVSGPGVISDPE